MRSSLNVSTNDGRNFTLLEDLIFARRDGSKLRCRIGSTTDGMSIPLVVKGTIPAAESLCERGFLSGVLHDGGYRGTLDSLNGDGSWSIIPLQSLTEPFCDALIKEALESQGIDRLESMAVFLALKEFGWRAFADDRK